MAFADNAVVKGLLERSGEAALPIILVDGEVAFAGRYPTRDELARWLDPAPAAPETPGAAAGSCCSVVLAANSHGSTTAPNDETVRPEPVEGVVRQAHHERHFALRTR